MASFQADRFSSLACSHAIDTRRLATAYKLAHEDQACAQTVRRYGALSMVRTVFLKKTAYFRILTTVFYRPDGKIRYGVRYGAKLAQHLPFQPPACSSHVLTPHNTSLDDPEAGLGLHQLGGRAQQWLA